MTGETRWVTVRTPQIGDMATYSSGLRHELRLDESDPFKVVGVRLLADTRMEVKVRGTTNSRWLPADYYTFKRAELVPDLEPTDADVAAFRAAYNSGTMLFSRDNQDNLIRAGLRAVLALRAEQ